MDKLIDELKQLIAYLDKLAIIDHDSATFSVGSQYYVGLYTGKATGLEISADWIREIVDRYTNEIL